MPCLCWGLRTDAMPTWPSTPAFIAFTAWTKVTLEWGCYGLLSRLFHLPVDSVTLGKRLNLSELIFSSGVRETILPLQSC